MLGVLISVVCCSILVHMQCNAAGIYNMRERVPFLRTSIAGFRSSLETIATHATVQIATRPCKKLPKIGSSGSGPAEAMTRNVQHAAMSVIGWR